LKGQNRVQSLNAARNDEDVKSPSWWGGTSPSELPIKKKKGTHGKESVRSKGSTGTQHPIAIG